MKKILDLIFRAILSVVWLFFLIIAFRARQNLEDIKLANMAISLGIASVILETLNLFRTDLFKIQITKSMRELTSGNLAKKVTGSGEYAAVADTVTVINRNTKKILSETCEMAQRITTLSDNLNETIKLEEINTNQIAMSFYEIAHVDNKLRDSRKFRVKAGKHLNKNRDNKN